MCNYERLPIDSRNSTPTTPFPVIPSFQRNERDNERFSATDFILVESTFFLLSFLLLALRDLVFEIFDDRSTTIRRNNASMISQRRGGAIFETEPPPPPPPPPLDHRSSDALPLLDKYTPSQHSRCAECTGARRLIVFVAGQRWKSGDG